MGDCSFLVLHSRLPLLGGASAYCGCSCVCPLEKILLPDVKMMHYDPLESESAPCALELEKTVGQESIKDRCVENMDFDLTSQGERDKKEQDVRKIDKPQFKLTVNLLCINSK